MSALTLLTAKLRARQDLSGEEASMGAALLASGEEADSEKAAFLIALADKGETAGEVAAFASAFRGLAIDPGVQEWAPRAVDIVGTGGDHAGGFNVSSLVVLTLASAGVPVMKHGNRGITSKCGSADLLAGLGVDLAAPPEKLRRALEQLGFVFFFAPNYHPAFKHIGPVRKLLAGQGRRSVFNILGPLINPGRPAHVLLGSFSVEWAAKLAAAADVLGVGAGLAVHGIISEGRGIDELTTATANKVYGAGRLRGFEAEWRAADFGLPESRFADLAGSDLAGNLCIVADLLEGRGPEGLVNTIVLNTAVCLWLVGRVRDPREALALSKDLLLGGAVRAKIEATRTFYSRT